MVKRLFLGCGLALVVIGSLAGIMARTLLKVTPKIGRSETATRGDIEIKVVETGTIEALSKVEVKSKAGGPVSRLLIKEGDVVRKGQVLGIIDPREINSQVAALRSQMAAAQARLEAARKTTTYQKSQTATGIDQYLQNVEAAKARLQAAETEAKAQPELTKQSIDIAHANLEAAQATLKAQQDSLELMTASTHPNAVAAAQSAFDQAKAQAVNAQHILQRQRKLLDRGFVSQQVVDSAETDEHVAQAHLQEVKERLDRIKDTNRFEEQNLRSQIASAASQVRQAEASLAQAKSNTLPLTKKADLENARAALAQAKAQLAAAKGGRTQDLMRGDEAVAAAADVEQIANQLKERLINQSDTTLVAPMSGVVTKKYVEVGDMIASGISSFSSGTPVCQVSDLHTMLVKINVNEVDIEKLKIGMTTDVTVDASRGVVFKGHVSKISPAAQTDNSGSSSSSTQSVIRFPVEIRVDHADPRLKPGMSAHCTILVAQKHNVLRLPVDCVDLTNTKGQSGTDKATVQIVTTVKRNGQNVETTVKRDVQIGLRGDNYIELLDGIKEGEKVRPAAYAGPPRKTIEVMN